VRVLSKNYHHLGKKAGRKSNQKNSGGGGPEIIVRGKKWGFKKKHAAGGQKGSMLDRRSSRIVTGDTPAPKRKI